MYEYTKYERRKTCTNYTSYTYSEHIIFIIIQLSVYAQGRNTSRQNFIILMLGMCKQQQHFIWKVISCVIGHDLNSTCVNLRKQRTEKNRSGGGSSSSNIESNDAFIRQ